MNANHVLKFVHEPHVLDYIREHCRGRENAITAPDLTSKVTFRSGFHFSERMIREVISNLRKEGHPIASAVNEPAGYFWPVTEDEARQVIGHFYSRLKEISAIARGVEHGLQEMFPAGQMKLEI